MNAKATSSTRLDELTEEALAGVVHELRTPVQAIVAWAALLRRGTLDPQQTARAIETIGRCAAIQARLIDDLLDRTRIRRGELDLNLERIDVGSLVTRAGDAVLPLACALGIGLRVRRADGPCDVVGDAVRLEQVLFNLLTNALKFSPPASNVEMVVEQVERNVRILVRDWGIGIRPEFLPHVFDRFRRGEREHRRSGLGLGLAIARHIVRMHGGWIRAESEGVGKGSRLSVALPCARAEALQAANV
jgi:signal transduction histidine kinase